jgi:hypothetical protein
LYGEWPLRVLMQPDYIATLSAMLRPADFNSLAGKVLSTPHRFFDSGAPFVAEDDSGNSYTYCDPLPGWTEATDDWRQAADWFGVRPRPEWDFLEYSNRTYLSSVQLLGNRTAPARRLYLGNHAYTRSD